MIPREQAILNPDKYIICRRCRNWFDPADGAMHGPEVGGPLSALRALESSAFGGHERFQCDGCTRARHRTQVILFACLFGLLAGIGLLEHFGWL